LRLRPSACPNLFGKGCCHPINFVIPVSPQSDPADVSLVGLRADPFESRAGFTIARNRPCICNGHQQKGGVPASDDPSASFIFVSTRACGTCRLDGIVPASAAASPVDDADAGLPADCCDCAGAGRRPARAQRANWPSEGTIGLQSVSGVAFHFRTCCAAPSPDGCHAQHAVAGSRRPEAVSHRSLAWQPGTHWHSTHEALSKDLKVRCECLKLLGTAVAH